MSTPVRPSTPLAQPAPSTPTTGTWKHPKLDEVVRRQNAAKFSADDVKKILYNIGGITVVCLLGRSVWHSFPGMFQPGKVLHPYADYVYHALNVVFVFNIIMACLPLFRSRDDISDIALTPGQRKLMALPPRSAPPTPGSHYITPPRYARTPTPLSGSPASKGNYSDSPLSGKGSPISGSLSGSPFSPGASPLLQKAMSGGLNGTRRHSYGSPSPLGPGAPRMNVPETPGTPSPTAKGVNVGLNSKWLYDKTRRNSGTSRLYS